MTSGRLYLYFPKGIKKSAFRATTFKVEENLKADFSLKVICVR